MQGGFDDYIGNPKENGYEALHTTVMCEGGHPLEVQIKTTEMHQVAEYGVAAHWRYKEGKSRGDRKDRQFEEKMSGLRQVLEWQREASGTEEFLEGVKQDLFSDQVFVYTPKGDIVQLAAGSTPWTSPIRFTRIWGTNAPGKGQRAFGGVEHAAENGGHR